MDYEQIRDVREMRQIDVFASSLT